MSQLSFSDAELHAKRKVTRREKFLAEMERAIPWKVFADLVEPHYPKPGNGRRPYPLEVMLRIHFMQQWFNLSDPAMEEALYDSTSIRNFAKLSLTRGSIPDETTILNFRHLLEKHNIAADALEAVNLLLQDQGMMVRKDTRCCMVRRKWCWAMRATGVLRSAKRIRGATSNGTSLCVLVSAVRWGAATWAGCWNPTSGPRRACARGWSTRFG